MPNPSISIQRPDLGWGYSEFSLAAQMQGFKSMEILTPVPVSLATGSFSKVVLEELLSDDRDAKRASDGSYQRDSLAFTQDSYTTVELGLEEVLDRREMAAFAYTGLEFSQLAADRALAGVLRAQEIESVGLLQSTSTFGNTGVSTEWSTAASCTPVSDVKTGIENFRAQGGLMPNVLAMSGKIYRNVRQAAEVIDRIKYSGIDDPKMVDIAALAALFGVEKIVVFDEQKNSARRGLAASLADIWDDEYVGLYKVAMSGDPREPGVGRTFQFTGDGGGVVVEQYYSDAHRADVVRARVDLVGKIIHAEAGYLLSNITAA